MSEKAATPATSNLDRYIAIAKQQMSQPSPMPENAYSNEFVSMLIARIDAIQAENERLRGLCGETHQHLKNILTTPGTNITGSCYVCHDLLVRLDRASKETI